MFENLLKKEGFKPDYLSFAMLSFSIIRIDDIVTISKSVITTIITVAIIDSIAVFSDFIVF